jgi:gliding motility-associated-like protein
MTPTRISIIYFLLLLSALAFPHKVFAQWKVDATLSKALCDESGRASGAIALNVSGMPGTYTYSWSSGPSTSQITGLIPGPYTVEIENGLGMDTTITYTILQFLCDPTPARVFTPNGVAINDIWEIINSDLYPNMLVSVYNKWGQKMYENKGHYTPWDGRNMLGLPVDSGVYYFIIFEDAGNEKDGIITGSVNIIR